MQNEVHILRKHACVLSCSIMPKSLQPCGLKPSRVLCPQDFPGKNTGVGCHFPLQGIFLTQGLNPPLLHCRWILYLCTTREAPFLYALLLLLSSRQVMSSCLRLRGPQHSGFFIAYCNSKYRLFTCDAGGHLRDNVFWVHEIVERNLGGSEYTGFWRHQHIGRS